MKVLIVEDEQLAAVRLQLLLQEYDPAIEVMACLESIEETVRWLQTRPQPDLMLLDISLSDGHSFEIFKRVPTQKPVIFTTAYDNYALEAFHHFSIDYILKPVTAEALAAAMNKYRSIAAAFVPAPYGALADQWQQISNQPVKSRFLAKVGQRLFFIQEEEVAFFMAENKIVYLGDRSGNRFIINYTLEKLEPLLNSRLFFRINRKTIVHADAIEQMKPFAGNRMKLHIKGWPPTEEIIISRERVAGFKQWADSF
jgi:DNA-binding LytR/AlgR family response regulator